MGMRVRSCGVDIAHGGSRFRNSRETIAFPTDSEAPSLCGAEKIAHQKLHPEGFGPSLGTPIQVLRGGVRSHKGTELEPQRILGHQ